MTNPTTPFSWQMPTSSDLVTDLPADFETFGQAVATSMADLLGGTSGQILAKNSNTDMDFVWITNDQGDITAVNTTAPLAGGGTSGALTLSIAAATTSVAGAVQLSDSTATTSSVLAATPTAVKSAYDLANGAIPKTLIDAAGDLIVGTAADTAGRLGIGTAGQVLKVNSGATALEWGTAGSGGGKVLQVVHASTSTETASSSTTFATTNLTATITPSAASSTILILVSQNGLLADNTANQGVKLQLKRGASVISSITDRQSYNTGSQFNFTAASFNWLDSPATTSATTYSTDFARLQASGTVYVQNANATNKTISTITLMEIGA